MDDLKERVDQFNTMSLPGQPVMMHMGTSYLVNDLWREVQRLRTEKTGAAGAPGVGPGSFPYPDKGEL